MSKLSGKLMQMAFMRRAVEKRTLAQREMEEAKAAEEEAKRQEDAPDYAPEETVAPEATDTGKGCTVVYVAAAQIASISVGRMSFRSCNPEVERLKTGAAGSRADDAKSVKVEDSGMDVSDIDMSAAFKRGPTSQDSCVEPEPKLKRRKM